MAKIPILFLGDSPSGLSGLGRILRDVARLTQAHMGNIFDVATFGLGQPPSDQLALRQYPMTADKDWIPHDLPYVWKEHVGNRDGILFCIWDISRLLWMAYPDQCSDPLIRDFFKNFKGRKWIYPAIDGAGPNGKMPAILADALSKFDRVLNYTEFSAKITGYPDVCTHGIDTKVFYPRPEAREKIAAKFNIKLDPDESMIGIVATNQPRKDWGMAFGALALLNQQGVKARVWIHTDVDMRHWDLKSLYIDFGLHPNIKVFLTPYGLTDDDLAVLYSACDVTLGIGPEGAGYPILESMACGVPCITGRYAGQTDYVPMEYMVSPRAFRYEGIFAIKRPVYDPEAFYDRLSAYLDKGEHKMLNHQFPEVKAAWSWDSVWPSWEKWIRKGLK